MHLRLIFTASLGLSACTDRVATQMPASDGGADGAGRPGTGAGDGAVADLPPPVGATVGDPCGKASECAAGERKDGICLWEYEELGVNMPGGYCTAECATGADCPSGDREALCLVAGGGAGRCLRRCDPDASDCREEYECVDLGKASPLLAGEHACLPPIPERGGVGGTCEGPQDCPGGFCVTEDSLGVPGGYCIRPCGEDGECPEGSFCHQTDDGNFVCVAACEDDEDCREGLRCTGPGEPGLPEGACWAGCTDDDPCTDGRRCTFAGTCAAPMDPDDLGGACASHMDCPGGFCLTEEEEGAPGGACIALCAASEPECPEGGRCIDVPSEGVRVCIRECEQEEDCREGYRCLGDEAGEALEGLCVAGCTGDDQCTGGRVCALSGECTPPFEEENLGAACEGRAECPGGQCLPDDAGFPDGLCVAPCDPDAKEDGCPEGGLCIEQGGRGACWPECEEDGDCREDYECFRARGAGICRPELRESDAGDACDEPRDCRGGVCNPAWPEGGFCFALCSDEEPCPDDGRCVGDEESGVGVCLTTCEDGEGCRDGYECGIDVCWPVLSADRVGGTCEDAFGDCPGGFCVSEEDGGFPGGLCTRLCGDTVPCPEGTTCLPLGDGPAGEGVCLRECGDDEDCREGTVCDGDLGVCLGEEG